MNRFQFTVLLAFCAFTCKGQSSIYADSRDGKTYPVITLGDLQWFKSNLRYETTMSWCAQHGKGANCDDGNFYYYNDIDSVCPQGWRVATWNDWENSVKVIMFKHGLNSDSLEYKTGYARAAVIVTGVNLINDTLGLDIKQTGWVQGKKRQRRNHDQANFFIIDQATKDRTTHIHAWSTGYLKHGHDFNFIDKPRKQRRLSVRCVKNRE